MNRATPAPIVRRLACAACCLAVIAPAGALGDASDGGGAFDPPDGGAASESADGGTPSGAATDGKAAPEAATSGTRTVTARARPRVDVAVATTPAGEVPLAAEGRTPIDPAAGFRVELAAHLDDARLVLLDEADAMVASRGAIELRSRSTRFTLTPEEPLRPGSRYALVVEGTVSPQLRDPSGVTYPPVVLGLQTTGERPRPLPAPKRPHRRRR